MTGFEVCKRDDVVVVTMNHHIGHMIKAAVRQPRGAAEKVHTIAAVANIFGQDLRTSKWIVDAIEAGHFSELNRMLWVVLDQNGYV